MKLVSTDREIIHGARDTTFGREQGRIEQRSFILLLVLVTLLFVYLLKPFFGSIFWACIIGLLFYPLHMRFLKAFGDRPSLPAVATLAACVTIGIIPALFVIGSFFQEGALLYQRLQSGDIAPGR